MNRLNTLTEMLTYKRPFQSKEEEEFIERFIDPIKPDKDAIGNRIKIVGNDPTILFSSHTDTVHAYGGRQNVYRYENTNFLCVDSKHCLGADDGAGVWLMLQMIEENVPGIYVFHRGEEVGAHGSRWILENNLDLLKMADAAIAFDRRGTTDIVTKQGGRRTASDEFAHSLSSILDLNHKPANGIFTDTKVYSSVIPECSNVSVGYYNEHGPREILDTVYLFVLMKRALKADWTRVTIHRDPEEIPSYTQRPLNFPLDTAEEITLISKKDIKPPTHHKNATIGDLCDEFPEYVAAYLEETGVEFKELDTWISDTIERDWSENDDQSMVI